MSQNLHNFLHLGHHKDAVLAVIAAINTYIFHTNGDRETNQFASEIIGNLRTTRFAPSGNIVRPFTKENDTFKRQRPEEVKNIGSFSIKEKNEPAIRPEDFGRLKRGGDGFCEAVIVWLSHKFACNRNRNYCVRAFQQEPR